MINTLFELYEYCKGVFGTVPIHLYMCRYGCRTELTEVSGTDMDVVPNLPKCPAPVLMLYRNCRSGMKVCTGTGDTGIHIVPNLLKRPVTALRSYRTY